MECYTRITVHNNCWFSALCTLALHKNARCIGVNKLIHTYFCLKNLLHRILSLIIPVDDVLTQLRCYRTVTQQKHNFVEFHMRCLVNASKKKLSSSFFCMYKISIIVVWIFWLWYFLDQICWNFSLPLSLYPFLRLKLTKLPLGLALIYLRYAVT